MTIGKASVVGIEPMPGHIRYCIIPTNCWYATVSWHSSKHSRSIVDKLIDWALRPLFNHDTSRTVPWRRRVTWGISVVYKGSPRDGWCTGSRRSFRRTRRCEGFPLGLVSPVVVSEWLDEEQRRKIGTSSARHRLSRSSSLDSISTAKLQTMELINTGVRRRDYSPTTRVFPAPVRRQMMVLPAWMAVWTSSRWYS